MMLIRDVPTSDSQEAYKELESNIRQLQTTINSDFLMKVFGGKLSSQCLNFFQMPIFNQEIDFCRQRFLTQIHERWMNGSDLVESFKIVLAQLFIDDDTDIDIHKIKVIGDQAFQRALEMFYNGKGQYKEQKIEIKVTID